MSVRGGYILANVEKIACASEILIKCLEGVGAGVRKAYGTCTFTVSVSLLCVGGLGVLGICSVIC